MLPRTGMKRVARQSPRAAHRLSTDPPFASQQLREVDKIGYVARVQTIGIPLPLPPDPAPALELFLTFP